MTKYHIEQQEYNKWFLWCCPNIDGYEYHRYDGCYYTKLIDDAANHIRRKQNRVQTNYIDKNICDII